MSQSRRRLIVSSLSDILSRWDAVGDEIEIPEEDLALYIDNKRQAGVPTWSLGTKYLHFTGSNSGCHADSHQNDFIYGSGDTVLQFSGASNLGRVEGLWVAQGNPANDCVRIVNGIRYFKDCFFAIGRPLAITDAALIDLNNANFFNTALPCTVTGTVASWINSRLSSGTAEIQHDLFDFTSGTIDKFVLNDMDLAMLATKKLIKVADENSIGTAILVGGSYVGAVDDLVSGLGTCPEDSSTFTIANVLGYKDSQTKVRRKNITKTGNFTADEADTGCVYRCKNGLVATLVATPDCDGVGFSFVAEGQSITMSGTFADGSTEKTVNAWDTATVSYSKDEDNWWVV